MIEIKAAAPCGRFDVGLSSGFTERAK